MHDGTFTTYQHEARKTAAFPRPQWWDPGSSLGSLPLEGLPDDAVAAMRIVPLMYVAIGLGGEAGEVLEQVKKTWRNNMEVMPKVKEKIADELGDVLWYAASIATELGLNLSDVACANLDKLRARQAKGELKEHS